MEKLMMHGVDWDGHNVDGWLASEKFDGCRAFWTGEKLLTKSGREYRNVPEEMLAELWATGLALDCELCVPHSERSLGFACDAALRGVWSNRLKLCVFDLPMNRGTAKDRVERISEVLGTLKTEHVKGAFRWQVTDVADALHCRTAIQRSAGEGIMLLRPDSLYRPGRVDCLLKMK